MSAAITYERNGVANFRPSLVTSEEAKLLAKAKAGDHAAFERLVMHHWKGLLRITQRILRNREDAEDALQNALLDAFRNLSGFEGRAQFSSWLTRIAVNAALMRLRVNRRERGTSIDEVDETGEALGRFLLVETRPNPEQEYLSKECRVLLEKGFKKLGPLYGEVLHLRGVQELSAKETARILEVPVGTVKARLHRARIKLTRHVQSIVSRKRHRGDLKNQPAGAGSEKQLTCDSSVQVPMLSPAPRPASGRWLT
jgi:RNA polymerase sigma-70 factor, ECF subfamily